MEVETIEKQGDASEFFGIKSSKTFRNYIENRIGRVKDIETRFILKGVLEAYEHFHPKAKEDNFKLEIEIISGWKGIGDIRVYLGFDNDFRINVPIKDKVTHIVSWSKHHVKKEDLNAMIRVIKKMDVNEEISCYEIAKKMGLDWKNDVWKNRTKVYFPKYYYPIKILEKLKIISYSGKGDVKRLV